MPEDLIRNIKKSDFNLILNILKNEMGKGYLDELKQEMEDCLIQKKIQGYVLLKNNDLVGYISWREKIKVAYLETIVINTNYQNKGMGTKLLNYVLDCIKQKNIQIVNVVTDADNSNRKTINFYLKNGFDISGCVDHEFFENTKQIHLTKKI